MNRKVKIVQLSWDGPTKRYETHRITGPFVVITIFNQALGEDKRTRPPQGDPRCLEVFTVNTQETPPFARGDEEAVQPSFEDRDAAALLDLLTRRLGQIDELLVVCMAGLSRSPQIAAAIARLLGQKDRWTGDAQGGDQNWLRDHIIKYAQSQGWSPPQ